MHRLRETIADEFRHHSTRNPILTKNLPNSKQKTYIEVKNMYSQEGHRKRLRERFREEGLDHFDEVNVLLEDEWEEEQHGFRVFQVLV